MQITNIEITRPQQETFQLELTTIRISFDNESVHIITGKDRVKPFLLAIDEQATIAMAVSLS